MTKGFPGNPFQQIALHSPMCKLLGYNQAKTGYRFGPGKIVEIEAVATQYATGSENGGKLFRFV